MAGLSSRDRVINLLNGGEVDRAPCFSGMGNITVDGLKKSGVSFVEAHKSPEAMARAAASSFELYGFESAVVPFDLGVEAEALGCRINFYEHSQGIIYPTVRSKILHTGDEVSMPEDFLERGRIPLLARALEILKESVGDSVAIGSYVLGPFTLAGQLMDLNDLLKDSFKRQRDIGRLLNSLVPPLTALGNHLLEAGADFITVREMGASADIISPRMFRGLVMQPLKELISGIQGPRILHICGDTNPIVGMMQECGAEAISVEQKNDVAATRRALGDGAVILGNIDAFNLLVKASPEEVREAVRKAVEAGVKGVMPGCDIWPEARAENMRALVEATVEYSGRGEEK
jgi:[methyl-Co(III) methanol-specific corrinoid protein]:coenzyme M methyltransferase